MHDTNPVLSLRNVGVSYKRNRGIFGEPFWALRDVSFDVYHGETLGIIGRNGAGKSTLLRLMSGIIKPDHGTFTNHGDHQAALLSLQLGFIPHLTGRENAIMSGMLMGLSRQEIEDKLTEILDFSELGKFFDEPINTYSSGMSARLGFSTAFHADPDILLIDEVLGVGDANFKKKSTAMMREKIHTDKTVVFISHDSGTLQKICDRVIWIEDGVSRMEGDPSETIQAYHDYIATHQTAATREQHEISV